MSGLDELEKLHQLYQKKLITKKEYEEQRQKLLAQNLTANTPRKSRLIYILLALFLGVFGVHNFYAGYIGKGVAQLLLTILSLFILSFVVYIWAVVEIITVKTDANGQPMSEG